MSEQTYMKKKAASAKGGKAAPAAPVQRSVPNSAFLTDGASRIDLPEAMRSKMESAYGTDLSAVKVYQSQKVADGGAEAVTMGNTIAFAPGKFDMTSQSGQALLGHEMSHVVSQSRGEVQGNGVVENAALEARADREGAMAAAGEQVYNGPVTAPLSSASPSGMAGPMQCKKKKTMDAGDKEFHSMRSQLRKMERADIKDARATNYAAGDIAQLEYEKRELLRNGGKKGETMFHGDIQKRIAKIDEQIKFLKGKEEKHNEGLAQMEANREHADANKANTAAGRLIELKAKNNTDSHSSNVNPNILTNWDETDDADNDFL